jgi:hypothetical protein
MNHEEVLRECKKCHGYKPLNKFGTNKNNDKITFRHTCIKCFGINRKAYLHNFYETKSKPKNEIKRIERNKLKIPKVKKVKKTKSACVQPLLEQLDPPLSTPVNLTTGALYQHMSPP